MTDSAGGHRFKEDNINSTNNLIDRGYFFGENIFTSFKSKKHRFYFLNDHLDRIKQSIQFYFENVNQEKLKIALDKVRVELAEFRNKQKFKEKEEIYVRIMVEVLSDSLDPFVKPQHFNIRLFFKKFEAQDRLEISADFYKINIRESQVPIGIKMGQYANKIQEMQLVRKRNFDDILYIDSEENLLEGTTSNIFFSSGNKVYTPQVRAGIFPGITRDRLIKAFKMSSIGVKEGNYSKNDILNSDQAWYTNSGFGLLQINKISNKDFKIIKSGLTFDKIKSIFDDYSSQYIF